MDEKDVARSTREIVELYLTFGPEPATVDEYVEDYYPDADSEDNAVVYVAVRKALDEMIDQL